MHTFLRTLVAVLFFLSTFLIAQPSKPDSAKKADTKWDITLPHGPTSNVEFDTDEGTWISCDVGPDGTLERRYQTRLFPSV